MDRKVILTGLRANNDLTLGNYLGALLPTIDMAKTHANEYDVNLFVPDLHSFTTPIDHSKLYQNIIENLRVFAAAGLPLDHPNVRIYRQSFVPAHSELTWILDCFTGFGEMSRMTQFKDKSVNLLSRGEMVTNALREENGQLKFDHEKAEQRDLNRQRRISVGLFNYPVLMAADILLYNASYVPVGDDQTQHLEFARDIAMRMNNQFGENLFIIPEPAARQHEFFGKDQGLRIRDLQEPTKKMSKSDETGKGVIFLSDTPEAATKKIMSATTDSFGEIQFDIKERPGISNLLQILELLSPKDANVKQAWEGTTSYGDLKKAVAEKVANFLRDFQARLAQVDEAALMQKLAADEEKMNEIANATLLRVQKAVGLRPR